MYLQGSDLDYLFYLLKKFNLKKLSFGSGQPLVKASELSNLDLFVSNNKTEKKKISDLFTNLDNLITLHQRKYDNFLKFRHCIRLTFSKFDVNVWEQRKAKELCSITTGKSNTQDQVQDGKYPFYIRSDVPVRSNRYLYDEEAVITIGDGNIGRVFHYVNGKFDLHQRCYKMADFKALTAKYFYYYFSTKFYERAMSMTAKATVDSVRLEMISDMEIKFPKDTTEQTNISELLTNLDNLITLHQRKHITIFYSWEQRKFIDFGTVSMCKRIFKDETSENGDIPFYKIGTFGDKADAFISNEKYEFYKLKFSYPNKGDILLSASGTIGRIVEYKGEKAYFQDSNIVWLNHNDKIKNSFLKVLYPTVKWDGIEGSTIKRLYNSNFLNTEIMVPDTKEQDKIGELFTNLDNLITLHQHKELKRRNDKNEHLRW